MKVTVKFIGPFKNLTGVEKICINLNSERGQTISNLIQTLIEMYGKKFADRTLEHQGGKLRPGVLILKNDVEIGVLNGLETSIKDGDEVTFIPVSHGG